jgi:phage terminase large subunit
VAAIPQLIELYWDDPKAFAEDILNMEPDEWQDNVFYDLAHYPKVSVRSGQGVGKTALEAAACLWFICTRPNCRVVATAPTRQQLNDVLWSEIKKWIERSGILKALLVHTATKIYMRGRKETWFATAKTATKPENMQGYHEDHMLFIVDEASGVADDIMEAVLGTLTGWDNKLLMCGNPNRASGIFYESHTSDRDKWRTHVVSSLDSKRTNKENIQMLIKKYGWDSNVVRVRVRGEFPKHDPDVFIPLELALAATQVDVHEYDENGKPMLVGPLEIGVDVARFGDDETVIAVRIGTHVFDLYTYNGNDVVETAGNVIAIAREFMEKYKRPYVSIKIDDSGVGGGVTDILTRQANNQKGHWNIVPCNFGGPGDDKYHDEATILWAHARDLLVAGQLHLPNDDELLAQLSTRKYSLTEKGKIKLESKKEVKRRKKPSPDRADAVVLCLKPSMQVKDALNSIKNHSPVAGLRDKKF